MKRLRVHMFIGWITITLLLCVGLISLAIRQRAMQKEIAELNESIGSAGDETRKVEDKFQKANRYLQILVGTSPETIFRVVDADIKAIDEGHALKVSDGLVLGSHPRGGMPSIYYMLEEALRLGATRAEVEKRFDRLEVLAKEGREDFGGNVDQQAAVDYRLMKTMLFR